jgi:hypothetical protein
MNLEPIKIALDRLAERQPERAPAIRESGAAGIEVLEKAARSIATRRASQTYSQTGIENYVELKSQEAAKALADLTAKTRPIDQRLTETRARLVALPEVDPDRLRDIRRKLEGMPENERTRLILSTDDPETLAAVQTAPRDFPLVSPEVFEKAMLEVEGVNPVTVKGYAARSNPALAAELADLEQFKYAVESTLNSVRRLLPELEKA